MKRYQHIIWDWNGTLFDDAWLCLEVMNEILLKRDLPLMTSEKYKTVFGFPVINYYQKLGFDFTREPFEAISTEFICGYETRRVECQLRSGVAELLQRNVERGISQSILSASQQSSLDYIVNGLGIRDLFARTLGIADHHAFGKVELGKAWITEIGVPRTSVVLIGDTIHDYEVAQAIGVDCYLIPSGHQSRKRLARCGAQILENVRMLVPED